MSSYVDWVRAFCLSLPHTTEKVRWEHNLLLCVGEKMYCVVNLEPGAGPGKIAFKCTPDAFAALVEVEGIIPAPYMARNHWVSVTDMSVLRQDEIRQLLGNAYRLVFERLPKKTQVALACAPQTAKRAKRKRVVKRRK